MSNQKIVTYALNFLLANIDETTEEDLGMTAEQIERAIENEKQNYHNFLICCDQFDECRDGTTQDHWSHLQSLNDKIHFWMDKEEEARSNLHKAMREKDYISNRHLRY